MNATTVIVRPASSETLNEINAVTKQIDNNERESLGLKMSLSQLFKRYQEEEPATWPVGLKKAGYSRRVVTRYVKVYDTMVGPDGNIPADLLSGLPADIIKAEIICALAANGGIDTIRQFITKHNNCRKLDREDLADLVREALGNKKRPKKTTAKTDLTPPEAIMKSWNEDVSGLLDRLEDLPPTEQAEVIEQITLSLAQINSALHEVEEAVVHKDEMGDEGDMDVEDTDVENTDGEEEETAQDEQADEGDGAQPDQLASGTAAQQQVPEELKASSVAKSPVVTKQKAAPASKPASRSAQTVGNRR